MNLRKYRDVVKFVFSMTFVWIYIPHIILYILSKRKKEIDSDLEYNQYRMHIKISKFWQFIYLIHNDSYFRSIFYHRIGLISYLFYWWRPGNKSFIISKTTQLNGGIVFIHPYCSIINAESIGENFTIRHLSTIGNKGENSKRPIIGDNVILGANVIIIGEINIGNNVIVGAGSVVTNSIPDNCTVAGSPARIIKKDGFSVSEKL